MAPATAETPRRDVPNAAPGTSGRDWYAMDLSAVLDTLASASGGLSDEEAASRLAHYGPNTLPRREPPSLFEILSFPAAKNKNRQNNGTGIFSTLAPCNQSTTCLALLEEVCTHSFSNRPQNSRST